MRALCLHITNGLVDGLGALGCVLRELVSPTLGGSRVWL